MLEAKWATLTSMNIIRVSDKEALEDFMLTERVRQVEELVIPELMREIARAISQLSVLPPGFIMRLPLTNTPKLAIAPVEAVKGYGLFAMEEVDSNTVIGEYTGVLTKGCDCSSLDYAFHYRHPNFTGDTRAYIDAQEAGNYTRFINHSIGNANITPEFVSDGQ